MLPREVINIIPGTTNEGRLIMILFLGSGVSLKSGLPSVSGIKTELLKAERFEANCDPRLLDLFNILFDLDTDYLRNSAPFKTNNGKYGFTGQIFRSETTYEDLFYLAKQIVLNGEGLKADITAESFTKLLRKKSRSFLKGRSKIDQIIDLHKLADEAAGFIETVVSDLLRTVEVVGLDLIVELAKSPLVPILNIVTLNHDTLVEQLLAANGIKFSDGFGEYDGNVRWFEDDYSHEIKVHIIKLHGSINWFPQGSDRILKPADLGTVINEWKNHKGELIKNVNPTPSFLTGVSKVFSYSRGIFADQHYSFQKLLRDNKVMLMSGYGWGDIPINFQLQNWLARKDENLLILLHQDPMALVNNSLELRHIYSKYKGNGKIIPIEQWLSETSISDISKSL